MPGRSWSCPVRSAGVGMTKGNESEQDVLAARRLVSRAERDALDEATRLRDEAARLLQDARAKTAASEVKQAEIETVRAEVEAAATNLLATADQDAAEIRTAAR